MTGRDGAPIPGVLADADLRRVARQFGVRPDQVRRDHAISHVLAALCRMEGAAELVFFGGTALARTLLPSLRLSEDIDLIARSSRLEAAGRVEHAIEEGLQRSHGHVTWRPRLSGTSGVDSALVELGGGIEIRIQLLGATGYPPWPTVPVALEQRYADAPPATLATLTAPAFAASKAIAWADRFAPRDLYDLWGLGDAGHIGQEAAGLLRRHGSTSRPDAARMFAQAPTTADWETALGHQGVIQVGPEEALEVVRVAWERALAGGQAV